MSDILAAAQTSTPPLLPVRADVDLPFSSHAAPVPPEPLPEPVIPPPAPKKGRNRTMLITLLLFLFATLPLMVLFTSQYKQIADIRNRAAGPCSPNKQSYCASDCHTYTCENYQWQQGGSCTGGECGGGSGSGNTTTTSSESDTSSQTTSNDTTSSISCPGEGYACGNATTCYQLKGQVCGSGVGAYCCNKQVDRSNCSGVCGTGNDSTSSTTGSTTTGGTTGSGTGGGGAPTDDCWKDLLSPSDVGCTPGVQQCNGGILAECQPEISRFCKVPYWKAVGTCGGGTPIPYAGATVSPNFGQTGGGATGGGSCGGNGQTCCDPFSSGGKNCDGALYCNTATGKCQTSKPTNLCQGSQGSGGQAGDLCEVFICPGKCDNGNQCKKSTGKVPCSQASLGGQCGQIDWLDTAGSYCGVKEQNCGGPCAGTTPSGGGASQQPGVGDTQQPTPTSTPIAGPQCRNIKMYRDNAPITPADLRAGDQITIAIVGTDATKARARVNGGAWAETSTKNASGEFTIQFTIPTSGGTFTIEAEVHQNGVWQ